MRRHPPRALPCDPSARRSSLPGWVAAGWAWPGGRAVAAHLEPVQLAHRSAKILEKATYYTLPWQHLVTFVSPFFLATRGATPTPSSRAARPFLFGRTGLAWAFPLGLALYATGVLWRRDRRVALAGAAVGLLLAMGKQTPLFPFLWHLPAWRVSHPGALPARHRSGAGSTCRLRLRSGEEPSCRLAPPAVSAPPEPLLRPHRGRASHLRLPAVCACGCAQVAGPGPRHGGDWRRPRPVPRLYLA